MKYKQLEVMVHSKDLFTAKSIRELLGKNDVVPIDNAYVDNRDWFVYQGENIIIPDMQYAVNSIVSMPYKNLDHVTIGDSISIIAIEYFIQSQIDHAFVVGCHYNFYHNMIDHASNLYFYYKNKFDFKDVPLLSNSNFSFTSQVFDVFDVRETRIVASKPIVYKARQLFMPRKVFGNDGVLLEEDFPNWIHRRTRQNSSFGNESKFGKYIYITRRLAGSRNIVNEDDIVNYLGKIGFQVLTLENMSVKDQVNAFSYAECVVAPHGAGLCHLIFCKNGTKVIELQPSGKWVPNFFRNISKGFSLDYHSILCNGNHNSPSFYVDLEQLKRYF